MGQVNNSNFPHTGVAKDFKHILETLGDGIDVDSVPTFTPDQRFNLSWAPLFDEVDQARALGNKIGRAHV